MTDKEKALIILEKLDDKFPIDWNFEEFYIGAIVEGLREIRKAEEKNRVF